MFYVTSGISLYQWLMIVHYERKQTDFNRTEKIMFIYWVFCHIRSDIKCHVIVV